MHSPSICIVCCDRASKAQAEALARRTGLPLLSKKNDDFLLQVCFDQDRVSLLDSALNTAVEVDFVAGTLAHRQQYGGGRGQAIAKAVGLKRGSTPGVLDITAGLGRDAYVLAGLGCRLTLVEQSAVLHALIQNGIRRGREHATSAVVLRNFIKLVNADSISYMESLERNHRPDVIYIDPMYPVRKKSARVKKDMQILQRLLSPSPNPEQLLITALACANERVVVKRPRHASPLGHIKPDADIRSRKTRYDVYLTCLRPDPSSKQERL